MALQVQTRAKILNCDFMARIRASSMINLNKYFKQVKFTIIKLCKVPKFRIFAKFSTFKQETSHYGQNVNDANI